MSAEPPIIDQAQLTGIICERPQNLALLMGAGASGTAGLPTATDIIWDLKRRYYCQQENQDISRQDVQLEAVRSSIQSYMASKGFPAEWAPEEYSTYFQKIFGDNRERQRRSGTRKPIMRLNALPLSPVRLANAGASPSRAIRSGARCGTRSGNRKAA